MKARIAGIGFAAALLLALPASAVGEEEASSVVPPENSAATQYTEAIPTAGGDKEAHGGRKPSPANALGAKNAEKLESHGKQGREVARIVAETAPVPSAEAPAPQREPSPAAERPANQKGDDDDSASAGGGSEPPNRPESPASEPKLTSAEAPSGSSGFGEVIAEATGASSSGQLGALLPLAIVATIAWACGYFWRQRRPVE